MTLGVTTPLLSQDASPQATNPEIEVEDDSHAALMKTVFAALNMPPSDLAAKDGNYLAQDKAELQTYYDLELSYKYIVEDYLRRQLKIDPSQGIIITGAKKSGQGFQNGLRGGDIVLTVDSQPVKTQYEFVIALSKDRGNQRMLKVLRDGQPFDLPVTLSKQDEGDPQFRIGISVDEISEITKHQLNLESGLAVSHTNDGGAAQKAGLRVYDIVTHVDGKPVASVEELSQWVGASKGNTMHFEVLRLGNKMSVNIVPESINAAESRQRSTSQNAAETSTRALLLGTELLNDGGTLMLLPRLAESNYMSRADAKFALAWSELAASENEPQTRKLLLKRIAEIESTLSILKEQVESLESPSGR